MERKANSNACVARFSLPPAPGQRHLLPDSRRQQDKGRVGAAFQGSRAREQARELAKQGRLVPPGGDSESQRPAFESRSSGTSSIFWASVGPLIKWESKNRQQ